MLQNWIESVFLKRVVLALAAGVVAGITTHLIPNLTPYLALLAKYGLTITVVVDPDKLKTSLTVFLVALSQGAHEWLAVKYPEIGKYI